MPGAVPRTSTFALTNATLPYVLKLAKLGVVKAVKSNAGLAEGLNVFDGHVTYRAVADSQGIPYRPILELLN
jgi:alanine dehydrogenase